MSAETIYAPASGSGKAGIAVLRLSGPAAGRAVAALTGADLPEARRAARRRFVDPETGAALDDGLLLWFPGPGSYTGEDLAELHVHGGAAVRAALLAALGALDGLRLAEPGEFTRRAVVNGRLDLSAAEGIGDLIEAETEAQRRQALRQADGALGKRCAAWAERLTRLAAHAEALIDFPDEDLPTETLKRNEIEISRLIDEFTQELANGRRGERLREGVRVAIVGPPNAGKSSFLNRVAGRDAAIVSARAGTTRDVIEVHLDLGGYPVVLADTAGLRESGDAIEDEGVRRARAAADQADLRVAMAEAGAAGAAAFLEGFAVDAATLRLWNKTDLDDTPAPAGALPLSVTGGVGLEAALTALEEKVRAVAGLGETAGLTRARHREAIADCRDALVRAREAPGAELRGEDLRLALRALGRITGQVDIEDLLDIVFADFCIGK